VILIFILKTKIRKIKDIKSRAKRTESKVRNLPMKSKLGDQAKPKNLMKKSLVKENYQMKNLINKSMMT
jgi:hypothetical protein